MLRQDTLTVVADAGYSNGADATPVNTMASWRARRPTGPSTTKPTELFDRSAFTYEPETDSYRCPAGRTLVRKQMHRRKRNVTYMSSDCSGCALKPKCTSAKRRFFKRHLDEDALTRMNAKPLPNSWRAAMRCRTSFRHHQADDGWRKIPDQEPQRNLGRDGPLRPRLQHLARHQHQGRSRLKQKRGPGYRSLSFPHSLHWPGFVRSTLL